MYMVVSLAGGGAGVGGLPLSGEVVHVLLSGPVRCFQGLSSGGAIGASIVRSDWYPIPKEHRKHFPASLLGYGARVVIKDLVLVRMYTDIEFSLYAPAGAGSLKEVCKFTRRVKCTGGALGALDADVTFTVSNSRWCKWLVKKYGGRP